MKYLNKNKKNSIKEDANYVLIENWIVLKKKHSNAIELPIFNYKWEFWNKAIIISDKDWFIRKLKSIKPNWWSSIWRQIDNSYTVKIWDWGKDIYELTDLKHKNTINQLTVLVSALSTLSNEVEPSDNLISTKDNIDSMVKPSELVAKFFPDEFENKQILLSDWLWVILDLRSKKNNISWDVFSSLFRYAWGNIKQLNTYLSKLWINEVEVADLFYVYSKNENEKIEFRNDWVYKVSSSWEWATEKVLIDKPLKLTWWYESNYDPVNWVINSKTSRYYHFENDIMFTYYANTDTFNRALWASWIRMQISWNIFQQFYSALDERIEKENIKEFDIVERNAIDLDRKIFVHWWKLLYSEYPEEEILKISAPSYTLDIWEQITLQEAKEYLRWYFTTPYQYIIFLWFLGSFLKKDLFKYWIPTPILQVIWFTASGKTEAIQLIMKLFWMSPTPVNDWNIVIQPRAMTLEWTRAFAVQKELWDYAPIFFDEFTWNISKDIEEMLRSVYNEKDAKKGKADQSVVTYKMLSPIVIGWEKSPSYMSVMNRSIYIQLDKSLQASKSVYNTIKKNLNWKCVLEDMWNKVKDVDLSKYKDWIDQWDTRVDNNYAWLHIINDIYWIFNKEELDSIIEEISRIQTAIIEGKDELKEFFVQTLVLWKKEQNIAVYQNKEEETLLDIYVWPDFEWKNHAVMAIKELVWDTQINDNDLNNIHMNVSNLLRDKEKKTEWIIKSLFRYLINYRSKQWQAFLYEYQ